MTRGASGTNHRGSSPTRPAIKAISALRTVDDALRHYLPSGGPTDSRAPVVRAANRAVRIRTAADVVADVGATTADVFPRARAVLEAHTVTLCARLDGSDPVAALPLSATTWRRRCAPNPCSGSRPIGGLSGPAAW